MALSFANLLTRVKARIRADLAVPVVNDLHDTSVKTWANEYAPEVIHSIIDSRRLTLLFAIDIALTGSGTTNNFRYFSLPADYEKPIALRVTGATVSQRNCRIVTPERFSLYDTNNFLTAPDESRNPVSMIADKIYVQPSTITAGRLDYVKNHPEIEANGTKFDGFGDILLTKKILREYYIFIGNKEQASIYDDDYIKLLAIEEKRVSQNKIEK